jgi:hypothetical protein
MPDMPTTTLIFTGSLIGIGIGVTLTALQVWLQGNVQNDAFDDSPRIELEAGQRVGSGGPISRS